MCTSNCICSFTDGFDENEALSLKLEELLDESDDLPSVMLP